MPPKLVPEPSHAAEETGGRGLGETIVWWLLFLPIAGVIGFILFALNLDVILCIHILVAFFIAAEHESHRRRGR